MSFVYTAQVTANRLENEGIGSSNRVSLQTNFTNALQCIFSLQRDLQIEFNCRLITDWFAITMHSVFDCRRLCNWSLDAYDVQSGSALSLVFPLTVQMAPKITF